MNEKEIKDAIGTYSKLSTEELMAEFIKQMAVQKSKDGGENVKQTIDRIKPLLNAEQRKRLEEVLKQAGQKS